MNKHTNLENSLAKLSREISILKTLQEKESKKK